LKVNSKGLYCIITFIIFTLVYAIKYIASNSYDFQNIENSPVEGTTRHIYLFGQNITNLCGSLSLGFFVHTCIVQVMQNHEKPENCKRDLFIGYFLTYITYMIIGVLGYIGFIDARFNGKNTIFDQSNFLLMMNDKDIIVQAVRFLCVIQLCSILPILTYIFRVKLFGSLFDNPYPSKTYVYLLNFILLFVSYIVLLLFANNLGDIIRYVGALTGLFLIYIIPISINMVHFKLRHPDPFEYLDAIKGKEITEDEINDVMNRHSEEISRILVVKAEDKAYSPIRASVFYTCSLFLIIIGLVAATIQFFPYNFLNVDIQKI